MDINTASDYLKRPYARVLTPDEDGGFIAEILEFEGCFTEGDTAAKALKSLEKIAIAWIETRLEERLHIPEPFAIAEMSGKFALRMPQSLHTKAAILAERDGVSLNTFIVSAVATAVGAHDVLARVLKSWEQLRPSIVQNFNFTVEQVSGTPTIISHTPEAPFQLIG